MFLAIFNTFLESISTIIWKKSLQVQLPGGLHYFVGYIGALLIAIFLIFLGFFDYENINLYIVGLILLIVLINIFGTLIDKIVYREEKLSMILPYTNLNKIISIFVAFFLFGEVSLISFFITFLATIIIILFSIDFKKFGIPRNIKILSFSQLLASIEIIITGYILLEISEKDMIVIYIFIGFTLLFSSLLIKKQLGELKKVGKSFYINRLSAAILGWSSYLITLFMIKDLGIVVTILLSFFTIATSMFFSRFILKEKIERKDLILTIIVSILIGLGFYFK